MAAPTLEQLNFSADDEPYDSGLGYQEKMQKLADNQTLVANYLATIEAAMEVGQSGYVPQGAWDASGNTYPVPVANGSWILSAAGTLGGEDLKIGDIIVYANGGWINLRVGSSDLVHDKSPQLGGVLDPNGFAINDQHNAVTSAANSTTIDCATGNAFSHVFTENTTPNFTNIPAAGKGYFCVIELIQDGGASGFTWSDPAGAVWAGGVALTMTSTASAKDIIGMYTRDGGTTKQFFIIAQDVKAVA